MLHSQRAVTARCYHFSCSFAGVQSFPDADSCCPYPQPSGLLEQAIGSAIPPAGTAFAGASAGAVSAAPAGSENEPREAKTKRRMLMPKNIKWRKPHKPPVKPWDTNRWKYKGEAWRGNKPYFGKYALQILEEAWINAPNIEACRRMMVRTLRRDGGKVWLRCFPHSAITWRGKETRMGGGKGTIQYWVQAVRPGYILFEVDGCTEETARRAFHYMMKYLPFKTKFLIKEGPSRFELGLAGSLKSKKHIPEEFRKKSDAD
ncbi:rplP [Symbiodinium sp. CCMP2592]|nr:rplP [Symbiodinium sp. CCMP2592]